MMSLRSEKVSPGSPARMRRPQPRARDEQLSAPIVSRSDRMRFVRACSHGALCAEYESRV